MTRAFRYLILAAASLIVAACSFTRLAYMNASLAYANATPVLTWMVGDYVDMSADQRGWVRERLEKAMAWHREQELPGYRRLLEDIVARMEGPFGPDEARAVHGEVRACYHRALERIIPDLADFLLQLDGEQVAQMERKFADDNRKFVKESVKGTPQDRRKRDAKKYVDNIEEFTGELSDAQRDLVFTRVAEFGEYPELQLAERRYRQYEVLALARAKPPRERMIDELRRLLVKPETWRRPEYLAKVRGRDQRLFEMMAELSTTLTAEQRGYASERLRGFIRDISYLTASNKGGSTNAQPARATDGT